MHVFVQQQKKILELRVNVQYVSKDGEVKKVYYGIQFQFVRILEFCYLIKTCPKALEE